MSDQISEKMARKILAICGYYIAEFEKQEKLIIDRLRGNGLIKPSKLDEAREWVKNEGHFGCSSQVHYRSYHSGLSACAEKYEAAITEILEARE